MHAHLDGGARLVSRRRRAHERVRGMSEGAKRPSESAGEGVAEMVPGCHRIVFTHALPTYANESVGEDVAENRVRVSCGRVAQIPPRQSD